MAMFRQGDILLVEVQSLPKTTLQEEEGCILAYGEATGHTHEVKKHGKIWVDVNDTGRRYLEVMRTTALIHQEHGKILLKGPAVFEIVRQREYSPQEIRHVQD